MSPKSQHVIRNIKGGWSVRQTGASRASRVFASQADAVRFARGLARREQTDVYVHDRDGSVREKDSYAGEIAPKQAKR